MATSFKKQKELIEEKIKPTLEKELIKKFNEIRQQGVLIGWNAFAIQASKNIENMTTVEEIKSYLKSEAEKTAKKLNIKLTEIQ